MKMVLLTAGFLCLFMTHGYGADAELFPMTQLQLGMSVGSLKLTYPELIMGPGKQDNRGNLVEGIIARQIRGNEFWDSVVIEIGDSKVQSWSYVKTKEFEQARRNVVRIFKALREQLGETSDKRVVKQIVKHGTIKAPLFVWTLDGRQVAFSHTPFKEYKEGDPFICRLTICLTEEKLGKLFVIDEGDNRQNSELFTDVLDETPDTTK